MRHFNFETAQVNVAIVSDARHYIFKCQAATLNKHKHIIIIKLLVPQRKTSQIWKYTII